MFVVGYCMGFGVGESLWVEMGMVVEVWCCVVEGGCEGEF